MTERLRRRARNQQAGARWFPTARRSLGAAIMIALALALSTAGWSTSSGAAGEPVPIVLKGTGSWGPYREIVTWQDDLYSEQNPIDLGYTSNGSPLGRQDFLAGNADFVISGRPFTAEELATRPGGAASLIDVPVQVEAMAFLLAIPKPENFETITLVCDPYDPETPDPDACIQRAAYTGPIRVPTPNLAAMVFRYAGAGQIPMSSWNAPETLAAMGVQNFSLPEQASPAPVQRSEPSATNYYLQEFAKIGAPAVWDKIKAEDAAITWEPISERLPRVKGASRQGVDQQSLQLGLAGADPASGGISGFTKGIVAAVPPSAKGEVKEAFPSTDLAFIEVRNAKGEWVAPTPESITKAVQVGGDQPLDALTNTTADGAYPLVWVNHLYAPATGLTADKAEALATTIRYLVTDGQKAAAPVGEGQLSAALVKQALQGADRLITSNCTGTGKKLVTSTDPGRFAPDLPGIEAIGTMAHCEAVGAQPTTTTSTVPGTIPTDTTPYVDPGFGSDPGFSDFPVDPGFGVDPGVTDTTPETVPTTAAPKTTTTTKPGATTTSTLPVAQLPMAVPTGKPTGYDQMSALLMGGSLPLLFGPGLKRLLLGLFL